MQTVKTLIADQHPIFLKGLETVLQQLDNPKIEIVASLNDGDEAIRFLEHQPVDLFIFDLSLPGKDGFELLQYIRKQAIPVKTMLLTMYDTPKFIRAAFKSEVDGYVLKNDSISGLEKGIYEVVVKDNAFMGQGVSLNKAAVLIRRPAITPKYRTADGFLKRQSLTKRELEILKLITQALSNKEIGKTHWRGAYSTARRGQPGASRCIVFR
jgi:DNA-binding NarL/FixJ family response regulator